MSLYCDDHPIHVAIRSYKRGGEVKTLKAVPFATIWCPESQGDEYRKHYGDAVITIPDEMDGNPARKMNAILANSPHEWTLVLDDDITRFGMFEQKKVIKHTPASLEHLIICGFRMAHEMGARLWGISNNSQPMHYHETWPLSLVRPIHGPFTGHLSPTLRYDERSGSRDDADFWLQNMREYRFTLRFNKHFFIHGYKKGEGGINSLRVNDYEARSALYLAEKWGSAVFKRAKGEKDTPEGVDLYMRSNVQTPIEGV